MVSVWFIRKDDPSVRKFDSRYPDKDRAVARVRQVQEQGLVDETWSVMTVEELK
jgi:hypothetical protein